MREFAKADFQRNTLGSSHADSYKLHSKRVPLFLGDISGMA
jgi:hypothetical protein